MQMNLNLSPPRLAVLRKALYQAMVILFSGIKICVDEWMAIAIAPCVGQPRILLAPELKPALLLLIRGAQHPIFRNNRRLEMVRQ